MLNPIVNIMKTLMSTFILCLSMTAFGNPKEPGNDGYREAMADYIGQMHTATSPADWQAIFNGFQRIAQVEKEEWLPLYYAALACVEWQHQETSTEKKDDLLLRGRELADRAAVLQPGNSEILALQGYIAMMRLNIDPMNRAQELAPVAMGLLQRAVQTDPENPRARLLLAQMNFGTAVFFGAGTEGPCDELKEALGLFEPAKQDAGLMPSWGREMAESLMSQCP